MVCIKLCCRINLYFTRLLYFADVNLFYKANGKRKKQKILNYENCVKEYLNTVENFETAVL